jgi:CBS domain-containing protein
MKVSEVMTARIEDVAGDESLAVAAKKMRDLDVGALPVAGDADKLAGMITDRDIVTRAIAEGHDPDATRVKEIMTTGVISCETDQSIDEAIVLMEDAKVRRLVITDPDGNAVGILSLGDVAVKYPGQEKPGEALEAISEPVGPEV